MYAKGKTYPRVYAYLKWVGHTPDKAAEIILDASRGDRAALIWIKALHRLYRRKK